MYNNDPLVRRESPVTISSMSRIAMYFASGESLYAGAALLLLVVISRLFVKHGWMLRAGNLLAWVALALMIMASPPFSIVVSLTFLAAFAFWFITSSQSSLSQTTINLQMGSSILLAIFLLVLGFLEFPHRKMPRITGNANHLVVIGDSISSGIDPHVAPWPLVLQQTCGLPVRNLARPGAQVSEGLRMANGLTNDDHLVAIEIGSNDLLVGVSAHDYSKALDALLFKVAVPNRTVVMFELPLVPDQDCLRADPAAPGCKIWRSAHPEALLRTSPGRRKRSGARRLAARVAQALSPVLRSCESSEKI